MKSPNGFHWCLYIWPWLILKVKVKVMQILAVDISKTVKDSKTIAIAST